MKRRKPKQIKALLGVGSAIINDNFENPASATKIKKRDATHSDCISFLVLRIFLLQVAHHLLIITLSSTS